MTMLSIATLLMNSNQIQRLLSDYESYARRPSPSRPREMVRSAGPANLVHHSLLALPNVDLQVQLEQCQCQLGETSAAALTSFFSPSIG